MNGMVMNRYYLCAYQNRIQYLQGYFVTKIFKIKHDIKEQYIWTEYDCIIVCVLSDTDLYNTSQKKQKQTNKDAAPKTL